MARRSSTRNSEDQQLVRRLDAIICLLFEYMQATKVPGVGIAKAARLLNSVGMTPTEVARVLVGCNRNPHDYELRSIEPDNAP